MPGSLADVLDAGVTALGDDARELGDPSGVDLNPLSLSVVLSAPCPVVVVILGGPSLLGGGLSRGKSPRASLKMDDPDTHLYVEPASLSTQAVAQHGRGPDLVVLNAVGLHPNGGTL